MLEQFSGVSSYYFDYKDKNYIIFTSWESTTNYIEELVYDEEDNIIEDDDLREDILTAFGKELEKQEK